MKYRPDIDGLRAIAVLLLSSLNQFPGVNALFPVVGATLLILFSTSGKEFNFIEMALTRKVVVFVGKISYSLYLWHWPLIAFLKKYTQASITMTQSLVLIVFSFLFSYVSWKYIENPFRKKSIAENRPTQLIVVGVGLFTMLFFVVLSNLVKEFDDSHWRYRKLVPRDQFKLHSLHNLCTSSGELSRRNEVEFFDPRCSSGGDPQNPEILLIGDSHASHFFPAFQHWVEKNQSSVRLLATASCPALFGEYQVYHRNRSISRCSEFARQIEDFVSIHKSVKTVVLAMRTDVYLETHDYRDTHIRIFLTTEEEKIFSKDYSRMIFETQLNYTIEKILAAGKNVILMKQVPMLKKEPLKCLESTQVLISKIAPVEVDHCYKFDQNHNEARLRVANQIFRKMKNKYPITVFDPAPFLPSAREEKKILYYDDDHINEEGAKKLSEHFDFSI